VKVVPALCEKTIGVMRPYEHGDALPGRRGVGGGGQDDEDGVRDRLRREKDVRKRHERDQRHEEKPLRPGKGAACSGRAPDPSVRRVVRSEHTRRLGAEHPSSTVHGSPSLRLLSPPQAGTLPMITACRGRPDVPRTSFLRALTACPLSLQEWSPGPGETPPHARGRSRPKTPSAGCRTSAIDLGFVRSRIESIPILEGVRGVPESPITAREYGVAKTRQPGGPHFPLPLRLGGLLTESFLLPGLVE